ncbi:TPA: hypothetical protein ACIBS5_002861 [Salmonella enterica subsp. diarizonae serovar 60-67:z35:-]
MTTYAPTDAVTAIGQINFTGNVTPTAWWRQITLPSGRPDQTAITLLSEIVYWYRPAEVRDETTGALTGYRKRFRGDKLQRSYQAFADQFGFGKRETTDALKRLRDAGLITLELRSVDAPGLDGVKMHNVLFVEPVAERIADITNPSADGTTPTAKRNTSSENALQRKYTSVETEAHTRFNVSRGTPNVDTNTENDLETKREIKKNSQPDKQSDDLSDKTENKKPKRPHIDYREFFDAYNEILGDRLPWAKDITEQRKAALRRLLPKLKTPTVEGFRAYLTAFSARAKSFYFGDNDRRWRANVDFLLREKTLTGVREGTVFEIPEGTE